MSRKLWDVPPLYPFKIFTTNLKIFLAVSAGCGSPQVQDGTKATAVTVLDP